MKKRFLNLFLVMLMVACVLPMAANAATKCWHDSKSPYCTVEKVPAKAATCTEDGYEEHFYCTFCKKEMKLEGTTYVEAAKTVIPAGHKGEGATCTECLACKTNHASKKLITEATAATCTEPGTLYAVYQCETCQKYLCHTWVKEGNNFPNNVQAATGHNYNSNSVCTKCGDCKNKHASNKIITAAKAATCTEDGARYTVYQCKNCKVYFCNKTFKTEKNFPENVIPAAHKFENNICTECGACKDNHAGKKIVTEATAATCTEPGTLYAVYYCETCQRYVCNEWVKFNNDFPNNVLEATVHTYNANNVCSKCGDCKNKHVSNKIITKAAAATCTEDGARYTIYQCKNCKVYFCNKKFKTENNFPENVIPAGHKWENGVCTVCNACQNNHVSNKIVTKAAAATCGAPGARYNVYQCKVCDIFFCNNATNTVNSFSDNVIPATGKHDYKFNFWAEKGKEATCSTSAIGVFKCEVCADYENITVKALGHDKDITVLKEATCTEDGRQYFECKRDGCGHYELEIIPNKGGHTEEVVPAVNATCTATGLTAGKKCSVCGETLDAQVVTDKIAHAWEDVEAQDPTCEEAGWNAHRACANCDETDGMTTIPASDAYHNYVNNKCTICEEYDPAHEHQGTGTVTTESTCTTKGIKSFTCSGCDYTWTEEIAKKAHTYGADARCTVCDKLNPKHEHSYVQTDYRAPTCTVEGKVTKKCSVCEDQTETLINATGHSYADGHCTNCGNPAACEHDNVSSTLTAATCSRNGREVFTCDDCGATVVSRTIPATGNHNYVNDRCTGCGKADPNKITVDNQGVYIVG